MGWSEKANSGYKITTGDGKIYIPNWLNAVKDVVQFAHAGLVWIFTFRAMTI